MVNVLIVIALFAWIMQIILSGWQIRRFNRAFAALCQAGEAVGVGRSGGRFQPRVVIAVAFDERRCVTGSLLMKGVTIFARPQPIAGIAGCHIDELRAERIFPHDQRCQNALLLALKPTSN